MDARSATIAGRRQEELAPDDQDALWSVRLNRVVRRAMNVMVLHVDNCPSVAPLMDQMAQVLAGRTDGSVSERVVVSDAAAKRLKLRGSPTVLVDGSDPFPAPSGSMGLSCRLYETPYGPRGFPTEPLSLPHPVRLPRPVRPSPISLAR